MSYVVKIQTTCGEVKEKTFPTYRESLCYATNYRRVKISQILQDKKVINEFHY
ncbi:hypothetical protein [Enterococcus olivae]